MAFNDSSVPVLSGMDTTPLTGPEVTDSDVVLQRRGAEIASNPASQVNAPEPANTGVPAMAGLTMGGPAPMAPPIPPVNPARPWMSILQGALWGLQGASAKAPGRGGFGAGLGMGVAAAQGMKFASVKAADDHVRAMKEAQLMDLQTQEAKLSLQMQYQNIAALNKLFNLKPDGTIAGATSQDMNAQAVGAHQTMAAASSDGQTLPQVQTVSSPFGHGDQPDKHVIDYYNPPSAQELQQNPTGFHDLVVESFRVDGKILTDQMWQTAGGAVKVGEKPNAIGMLVQQQEGQAQMVQDAYKRLYAPFGGKEIVTTGSREPAQITSMNQGTSASLHQQAEAYDKLPDSNPTISKILHGQAVNFDFAVENARNLATQKKGETVTSLAPAEAAAAGLKTTAEEAAKFDPNTPAGLLNIQKAQQDLIDKKYANADKRQRTLFDEGKAPDGETLNLTNAAPEMLVDQKTGQPIPTKMVSTMKPTQQESNRADFAKSTLHILDTIDKLRAQGKVPNGPITGLTAKHMAAVGLGSDSQEALDLIGFGSSASTGAHVGGRFNQEIMKKMDTMLNINMNDAQFTGAENAIREVMTPYATNGGRMSVAEFKQSAMATPKYRNGVKGHIIGFDKDGRPQWVPDQAQ